LSRQTGCNIETIRYYERIGLLPRARRAGRCRRYDADDVARLRFVRRARQLGFTLDDVRALMRLANTDGDQACAEARKLAATHVAEIRAKIADLEAMDRVLFWHDLRMRNRAAARVSDNRGAIALTKPG
jgi:MerR family mercuric resistance operon transcriptional regulator